MAKKCSYYTILTRMSFWSLRVLAALIVLSLNGVTWT